MKKTTLLLASMALAVLLVSGAVWADTFTVKNQKDSGPGSLRAAITSANAQPGRDVITFAPSVRGEINLKSELPKLRGELEIQGPGATKLTVRRAVADGFRIFHIGDVSTVIISGLTISNGLSDTGSIRGQGGGIRNGDGKLTVRNSLLVGNEAKWGGGISNSGDLRIESSLFSGNSADFNGGGGIITFEGNLTVEDSTFSNNSAMGGGAINSWHHATVTNSTFSGNEAKRGGGAIVSDLSSTLMVVNSTFYGNRAGEQGGAIYGRGAEITLRNSTISGNTAVLSGGGIFKYSSASFSPRMSIIARNDAPQGPDAFGTFRSGGYNLIGDTSGASGFGATDLTNTRSGLDPRGPRDNGGPTRTIALVSGSPAIDAVPRTVCPPPATDQRGISRPQDGDDDGAARCDIGAYERRTPAQ